MHLHVQKKLASKIFKCSKKKVWLDNSRASDIKEAITKKDIRALISEGAIVKQKPQESSRVRARAIKAQKRKNKRKGQGSRKGGYYANVSRKRRWIRKVRAQRLLLNELKNKEMVSMSTYADIYKKSSGGFFRSTRHIRLYLQEHNLMIKNENK